MSYLSFKSRSILKSLNSMSLRDNGKLEVKIFRMTKHHKLILSGTSRHGLGRQIDTPIWPVQMHTWVLSINICISMTTKKWQIFDDIWHIFAIFLRLFKISASIGLNSHLIWLRMYFLIGMIPKNIFRKMLPSEISEPEISSQTNTFSTLFSMACLEGVSIRENTIFVIRNWTKLLPREVKRTHKRFHVSIFHVCQNIGHQLSVVFEMTKSVEILDFLKWNDS